MGIFGFLKKDKAETMHSEMELPPLPSFDMGEVHGFGSGMPPLPESSLPPLPTEIPGMIPPMPEEKNIETPKMTLPEVPPPITMMEQKRVEARPLPETFPSVPDFHSEEFIPDKIPPLENLPEAPLFTETPNKDALTHMEMEEMPVYAPREEIRPKTRERRGPLFVRSDGFKAIADDIEQIRATFKEEDDIFFRIGEIKNAQDQKYEALRVALEDVQRKLLFIDRTLFENR